jgi:hypothetical protein
MKASGLSHQEYMEQCGSRIIADISKAVSAGGENIKMGLYGCSKYTYHGIFSFKKLYPRYLQLGQSSLYEAGNLDVYYDDFKASYQAVKNNWHSVPWMTGGTYGEIPSHKLEIMLYDCVLNGNAVGYYWFGDFDTALDYYYIAKALVNLSGHNELLKTGKPIDYAGDNKKLYYSCFSNGSQALMNVGNYIASETMKVKVTSPIAGDVIITDVKTGRILVKSGRYVTIAVDPQSSVLLSFKQK